MIADKLRKSILQQAIQGKLSEQLPTDGNASDLLVAIQAERAKLIKQKKIKSAPPLPPISPDEIPFDIPENWQWVRLGDIFNVHSGQNLTQKQMSKSGYPVYGGNGITGFHDKKLIDKDSLVIGRVGFYCGSVHKVIQDCWVTDNALIVNFFDEKSICKDFFVYLLRYSNLKNLSVATAQPVISGKRIYQKIIPLPPLAEQKRIVAKLEELMPLIERLDAAEKKLAALDKAFPDQLRKSILQQAIQGKLSEQLPTDGNASDLLADIRAEKNKLIADGKIKKEKPLPPISADEIPFDIPKNWQWVRLGDICEYIQRGKSPKYSTEKKYPVISQKCNKLSGFSIEQAKFIEPDSLKSYDEEKILKNEDLLWNSTGLGTVGRMAIYDSSKNPYELAVADSHVTVVRPFKNILHKFIFFFVISPAVQSKMDSMINGSTKQKELATATVKNLLIPLPPLAEQKRIVAKLEKILPLCDRLAEKLK